MAVYWVIRRVKRPQIVLQYLGRNPDPAVVRAAFQKWGIAPDEMTKSPRRLPLQTFINRGANSPGGLYALMRVSLPDPSSDRAAHTIYAPAGPDP